MGHNFYDSASPCAVWLGLLQHVNRKDAVLHRCGNLQLVHLLAEEDAALKQADAPGEILKLLS